MSSCLTLSFTIGWPRREHSGQIMVVEAKSFGGKFRIRPTSSASEYADMKDPVICKELSNEKVPKITVVVCVKRHHTCLFLIEKG